jgi:cytochrome b561
MYNTNSKNHNIIKCAFTTTNMKQKVNYIIDVLLVFCLIGITITGLVLAFAFESGMPRIGHTITFLGTQKIDWLPWHKYFGLGMIALMFVHLILHWKWMIAMTKKMLKN